jgi:hypothetical protein
MFEQQQIKEKSLFWIISTLLITVIIIGRIISYLLAFAAGFVLARVFGIDFIDKYVYIIAGIVYFIGYLIAGKIGVRYCFEKTRINKKEVKKIILIFVLFPIATYFIINFPIQIYVGGLKFAVAVILFSWKELIANLLAWIIIGLVVFYWINKKVFLENIKRVKIRKLEIAEFIILILVMLVFLWFFVASQKSEFGPMIKDLSFRELLDVAIFGKDNDKSETKDWTTYQNEDYGIKIKYPESWNIYVRTGERPSYFDYYKEEEFVEIDICTGTDKIKAPPPQNYMCVRVYCEARPPGMYYLEEWLLENPEIEKVERVLENGAERIDILEAYGIGIPSSLLGGFDTVCNFHKYLNYNQENEYQKRKTELDAVYEKILSHFRFMD